MKRIWFKVLCDSKIKRICYRLFSRWILTIILIILLGYFLHAQEKEKQELGVFEVTSRKPLPPINEELLGIDKSNGSSTYLLGKGKNNFLYKIRSNGSTFEIDALSSIEYAGKVNRIVVFGDSANKDLLVNCYGRVYSDNGTLINSLGFIASFPYVTTLTDNGHFILAGNKNKIGEQPAMALISFDANGNKQWEESMPDLVPVNVFSSPENNYIAVVLYNPETMNQSIYYYNGNGQFLFTNDSINGISGIEFLPSDKVVITTGGHWYIHNFNHEYQLLADGALRGNTIGRYPITAYPTKDIFFIVSVNNELSNTGFRLQAFSAKDGSAIAEKAFEGQPYYFKNRLVEVLTNDRISLITSKEIIELRIIQL